MTSGLRKAHKYIWLLLVIIVPIIIIFSIKDLNIFSSESNDISELKGSKEISLKSVEDDIVKASVYKNHIEIILKTTLKNSSSVVYAMNDKGNRSHIIGQLTTAGVYNFNINNLPKGLIIYDALKNVEITKFSF